MGLPSHVVARIFRFMARSAFGRRRREERSRMYSLQPLANPPHAFVTFGPSSRGTSLAVVEVSQQVEEKGAGPMVTITRSASGASDDTARALEGVVREVLADSGDLLEVQLGTWLAEDERPQFVCRVETPPAAPFGGAVQWRWWSPLVDGPEQLREALSAAVQARRRTEGSTSAAAPAASRSVAWGLHGKE